MKTTMNPPYVYVIRQQAEVNLNRVPPQEVIETDNPLVSFNRCYRTRAEAESRMRSFVPADAVSQDPAVYGGYSLRRCEYDDQNHWLVTAR